MNFNLKKTEKMEFNTDTRFAIQIQPNKWCSFYVERSSFTSGKAVDKYHLGCSNRNDYVDTITITIRKKLNEDQTKTRYLHKIVLITTLGDIFVFDCLESLIEHLTEFFKKYPNLIEFGYDYEIEPF